MSASDRKISRRTMLRGAGAGVALFTIVPRHVLGGPGKTAPSDKLNIAGVGGGGRGGSDLRSLGDQNIVAIADIDWKRGAGSFKRFPKAKQYHDFRKMLDEVDKDIDAVVVGTPDHTHAVAVLDAIARGKHVYCEKPLAHSVGEVRRIRKAALDKKVVTQLGNQGHSSDAIRRLCEWVWDGAIGEVKEVHASCSAFRKSKLYSPIEHLDELSNRPEVPEHVKWDLWLGPTKERPYQPFYHPWNWRGWTAFGTGAIGDWFCHVVDPAFWALDLGAPTSVQAEARDYDPVKHAEAYPPATKVTYKFPAKGKRGPVTLYWYDGLWEAPKPDILGKRRPPGTGAIFIGTEGGLTHGSHGAGGVRIVPEEKMRAYKQPEQTIPRVPGHHADWVNAIREGKQAGSNFEYGGPLTELALLGMIAVHRLGETLEWDAEAMKFTNSSEANAYLDPPYRDGWSKG